MKKLKSEDKGLFRNVCTCQVGMGIAMTMIGAVLPQIAGEYGLDYSFSGLMLSVQSAGYFIAGLAAGYLPRYFGARKCYVGLGAMAFIGLWLLMHTSQPFLLLLAMLLTGISKGSGNNFTNQFTANISHGVTGRLNFMHAFYPNGIPHCHRVRRTVFAACDGDARQSSSQRKRGNPKRKERLQLLQAENILGLRRNDVHIWGV